VELTFTAEMPPIMHETLEDSRVSIASDDRVERLRRAYPWPDVKPERGESPKQAGWLGEGTERVLEQALSDKTHVVVELGAWLGLSSRYIADRAPNATVISIDHWRGNPEHHKQSELQSLLPVLFETYQSECWSYRDRLISLRMSTLDGLKTVAEHGIEPDIVYIDAEHSYEAVTAELELASELFPRARLMGDDFDWRGVREAVQNFARRHAMKVERSGSRGWALYERSNAPTNGDLSRLRSKWVALVPHVSAIEPGCEQGLRDLEHEGIRVVRRQGSSQIDVARSEMISESLHGGYESILFIDADIGFDAADAIRLFERPEPVVSGVYAKKGPREVASAFSDGVKQLTFGPDSPGLYPVKYAATGFLRIRSHVLITMIQRLKFPLCNTRWGKGFWPFFLPIVVPQADGWFHYLGEDWAFSHRLGLIGVTPLADTSFRLYHIGPFGYSWEDAGAEHPRYQTYNLAIS
jgi:predicted O-methyltransferase YrrM